MKMWRGKTVELLNPSRLEYISLFTLIQGGYVTLTRRMMALSTFRDREVVQWQDIYEHVKKTYDIKMDKRAVLNCINYLKSQGYIEKIGIDDDDDMDIEWYRGYRLKKGNSDAFK